MFQCEAYWNSKKASAKTWSIIASTSFNETKEPLLDVAELTVLCNFALVAFVCFFVGVAVVPAAGFNTETPTSAENLTSTFAANDRLTFGITVVEGLAVTDSLVAATATGTLTTATPSGFRSCEFNAKRLMDVCVPEILPTAAS